MSSERWKWKIGKMNGFGDVAFQVRGDPMPGQSSPILIRNLVDIQVVPRGEKTDFHFNRNLFCKAGVYPDEIWVRGEFLLAIADAPEKVAEVCENEWNPKAIVTAKPGEVNGAAARIRKLTGG